MDWKGACWSPLPAGWGWDWVWDVSIGLLLELLLFGCCCCCCCWVSWIEVDQQDIEWRIDSYSNNLYQFISLK